MIRNLGVNDMKSSGFYKLNSQVKVDVSKGEGGCLTILSRGIPTASSIDKGIMFTEEHGPINAHVNSM